MATSALAPNPLERERAVCDKCAWAGTCFPLANLQSVILNQGGLEADYGWDIMSFTAEAKEQYRHARENGCPTLDKVREQAKILAPHVNFGD